MQFCQSHTWLELPWHANITAFSANNWVTLFMAIVREIFYLIFFREDNSFANLTVLCLSKVWFRCDKSKFFAGRLLYQYWHFHQNSAEMILLIMAPWKILIILRFNLSEFSFGNHSWKPLRSLSYIFANPFTKSKITTLVVRHSG